jgi:hypothetical protein
MILQRREIEQKSGKINYDKTRPSKYLKHLPSNHLKRLFSGIMVAGALFFGKGLNALPPDRPPDTGAQIAAGPRSTSPEASFLNQGNGPARRLVDIFDGGSCFFDERTRTIGVQDSNGTTTYTDLNTPQFSDSRPGEYLGMFCGNERILLFADRMVVVVRGRRLFHDGEDMPGTTRPAFNRVISQNLEARPVAWTAGDDGLNFFVLGSNGRLLFANLENAPAGDAPDRIMNIRNAFSNPPESNRPYLHYSGNRLYVLQNGSDVMHEYEFSPSPGEAGNVPRRTYTLPAPLSGEPSFGQNNGNLTIDYGTENIVVQPGFGIQ